MRVTLAQTRKPVLQRRSEIMCKRHDRSLFALLRKELESINTFLKEPSEASLKHNTDSLTRQTRTITKRSSVMNRHRSSAHFVGNAYPTHYP